MTLAAPETLYPDLNRLHLPEDLIRLDTQALLLRGPAGAQVEAHALALAAWYLCTDRAADQACGRCTSCHLWKVKNHPDVRVLAPETWLLAHAWPLPADAQKQVDGKARQPSRKTGIDAVRSTTEFAQMTATHPNGKVVVIPGAEHMTVEAANALLKVLEEPPGVMRFILASSSAHLLLPTIVSRCNTVVLPWRAASLVCTADERGIAQRLAQGDSTALNALSPAAAVSVCQKLCHDLMRVSYQACPLYFAVEDLPKPVALPLLVRWHKLLQDMQSHIEHPWREALLLENLAAQSARILRSSSVP